MQGSSFFGNTSLQFASCQKQTNHAFFNEQLVESRNMQNNMHSKNLEQLSLNQNNFLDEINSKKNFLQFLNVDSCLKGPIIAESPLHSNYMY